MSEFGAETLACRLPRRVYTSYNLLWRVTTPHIVYSKESLLTAGSLFYLFERLPSLLKGHKNK
jgi:hypothetical protein